MNRLLISFLIVITSKTALAQTADQKYMQHAAEIIQWIEQKDFKSLEANTTKTLYCSICAFKKYPVKTYYVKKNKFIKQIPAIFTNDLLERIKRNEAQVVTEADDKASKKRHIVLYTTYRENELGDGHEGVQLGIWLQEEKGTLRLVGIESIP